MGLYDNYKLANSNLVESFAGSTVPELTKMKDSLDNRYEVAKEKISGLEDMLVEAPILEADKQNWVNINNEAQAKIGELSKRPDLENTVLDVHTYSAKVANKLKSLALQKKTRDEYYGAIDKMDLPNDVKDMYKQESDQKYGGLKFDEYGKATNSYVGDSPTKNVDTPEKIRKALQILISSGDVQSYTQDSENGMYTIQTTNGVERRTANEVLGAMRSARAIDPEWQASDNQAVRARVFNNTKNVTDATVQQFLDKETSDTGEQLQQQEIKRLVGNGLSLKDAWKTIQTDKAKKDFEDAEDRYALGNTYTKTSSTKVVQEGPEAKDQRQRDMIDYTQKKQYEYAVKQAEATARTAKEADAGTLRFIGNTATLNVSEWAPTIKDLQEGGIAAHEKTLTDLSTSLKNKQAQLDAAKNSGDQRAQTTLSAEIADISNKIKTEANSVQMYRTIEKQALDEATRELHPKLTSFDQLKDLDRPSVLKQLSKTYPKGVNTSAGYKTTEQLADMFLNGQKVGTIIDPISGFNRTTLGGIEIYDANYTAGNALLRIKAPNIEKALTNAKTKSTKNFSIQDKAVTLDKTEMEAINSAEEMLGFVGNDGITPVPGGKPIGYDPTKTTRDGSMTEMTGLIRVTYKDAAGNVLASGYNTTNGTQIQSAIGRRLAVNKDPQVSATGNQWMMRDQEDVRYLMPGNRIETHPDGSPVRYWNGKEAIPVVIDINTAGTGSLVDKATGKPVVINGRKMENQPVSTLQQILTVSKSQQTP
jgi:hypothetical protein